MNRKHEPGGNGASAPNESEPMDELERAKQRVLEAGGSVTDRSIAFARRHPYVCAGAALAAGVVIGRVPYLRKMALMSGAWAGKRALENYAKKR